MAQGNTQDEMTLISKYKAGFTGKVPTEFSRPNAFEIKSAYSGEDKAKQLYGYNKPEGHPTPTSPKGGTI